VIILGALLGLVLLIAAYDLIQRKHAILRNFPVVGHMRYLIEAIGPELRQYLVADNDEELPFSRDERRWVYSSSKKENNLFGFGTDSYIEADAFPILKHAAVPYHPPEGAPHDELPAARVIGEGRRHPYRPRSIVNLSAMSFGALGENAVRALNGGAQLAGCFQNTGEGGIAPYHRGGADLVYQIGTGKFGCRDAQGRFSPEKLLETLAATPTVRMLELKLSQGAKPGHGGVLPGRKVTPEIAAIRGVPVGETVLSPPGHPEVRDADSLIDFVERLAELSGLPVGIKTAVGQVEFFEQLAAAMERRGCGPDFITVDGGEGGTGAAPLAFSDHVSLPFRAAFPRIYGAFRERGIERRVVWIGSGKLGFPARAILAFAMGCDLVNVAREGLLSIGCIQAQRCHTDRCPTGITTQSRWLQKGLDPELKSVRFNNYIRQLRGEILELTHAMGYAHPAQIRTGDVELSAGPHRSVSLAEVIGYSRRVDDVEVVSVP
jgi:glutamate synthase (ferredoxin)